MNKDIDLKAMAYEEHAQKLKQAGDIVSYYEDKRNELQLDSTERIVRYLDDPGRYFHRNILYAHRDFDKIFAAITANEEWAIVSGLNPSGALHFGHKAMLDTLLWFQQTFNARIYLPITNDESYVVGKASSLRESLYNAYELVIPSVIALGFDPKLTHIFVHSHYPDLANAAMFFSKHTNYNSVRRLFGWTGSENPGVVFYMGALQMTSIIMPQLPEFGGPKSVLVPVGIDQHPYISLSRDIANRLGLVPPSELIWKFLMGLKGPGSKMSSTDPNSAIYLTDTPDRATKVIRQAYTGGNSLKHVHEELGGIPEVCPVFSLLSYNFLTNDEWDQLDTDYRSGALLSSELKKLAIDHVCKFLVEHQKKREQAKKQLNDFLLRTPIRSVLELDKIPGLG